MHGSWMKRSTVIAMLLAATTMIAGAAVAERRGGRHGHDRLLRHIERGVERLELSADTKQAVYAALDEARGERRTLAEQLRAAHEQMRAVLDAPSPSLDAVLAQADSIGALETQATTIELAAGV
jgi:Spy/CpxP family protein refolding chaperone